MEGTWTQELQFVGSLVPCGNWAFECRAVHHGQLDSGVHSGPGAGSADDLMSLGQRRDILTLEAFPQAERQGHGLSIQLSWLYLTLTMGPISPTVEWEKYTAGQPRRLRSKWAKVYESALMQVVRINHDITLPLPLTPSTNWNPDSRACEPTPLPRDRASNPDLSGPALLGPGVQLTLKEEACASHCHGNLWASLEWGLGFLVLWSSCDRLYR